MEFQERIYENFVYNNDPDLVHKLWVLANNGKIIDKVTPVYFQAVINVATDASFDIFPAITNNVYTIGSVLFGRHSTTQTGQPLIEFYDPFTGVLTARYTQQTNNTTAGINNAMPTNKLFALVSRLGWNDNAATVGIYSVIISGYKIAFH